MVTTVESKSLAETISGLEALRDWHGNVWRLKESALHVDRATHHANAESAIESALAHLRSQEETVRKIADADVMPDLSFLADDDEAKAAQRLEMSDSWRKHRRERAKRLIRLVSILRSI